ncbi:hypothetical protein [Caldibacillus phage CBP1]|nr:hypothetical protein [Caldibacillus phage CBP1]
MEWQKILRRHSTIPKRGDNVATLILFFDMVYVNVAEGLGRLFTIRFI